MKKLLLGLLCTITFGAYANPADDLLNRIDKGAAAKFKTILVKSDKDFLNKLKMVEEELDETAYWLELIMELELVKPDLLQDLYLENKELLKIVVKSILTMRDKVNGKV